MESKERCLKGECFGGEEVNKIGCSMKGFNPVGRGHGRLEEEGPKHIICCVNRSLGLAVLLGSIWTRHPEGNTIKKKEVASGVVEFSTVVTLDAFNGGAELCVDIVKEIRENGESFKLEVKGKGPKKMGTVVQNDEVINTSNR